MLRNPEFDATVNFDLPSPTALRSEKKRRLRALLDAEQYLPLLVNRLSDGFVDLDTETTHRWAVWLESLRRDPAWEFIAPALDIKEAWPDVWHRARDAGFSEATEHHQAIFFTRLFERAVDDDRFSLARRAWRQALESWKAIADGKYLGDHLLCSSAADLDEDAMQTVLEGLLDPPLRTLGSMGMEALRLESWEAPPARRSLRFCLEALDVLREVFDAADGPVARGAIERVESIRRRLVEAVDGELRRRLERIDLAGAGLQDVTAPFDCAVVRNTHLDHPPSLDRSILRRGLDLIWSLRDIDRDEELGVIPPMLQRLEPCAKRLGKLDDDASFGLEGALADLLVFRGEEALSLDERQEAFEEALQSCPGHRNASRLLSYLLLERANRDLLKTAALPELSARIGPVRRRIRPLLERAAGLIDRAESLYPENELLDQYRSDLDEELTRFRMTAESDGEDR